MPDDREFAAFINLLDAEVMERCRGTGEDCDASPDFKENVFTQIFAERLEDIGTVDDPVFCFFQKSTGHGTLKANGFCYDEDRRVLTIFLAIYADDILAVPPPSEIQRIAQQAVRFHQIVSIGAGILNEIEPSSEEYGMVQRIQQLQKEIKTVRILIFIHGKSKIKSINEQREEQIRYIFDIWDLQRLFRVTASDRPYDEIEINIKERFGTPISSIYEKNSSGDYETYLVIFPAKMLHDIYDEFGPRLLELNVRSFLQAKTKVNRSIRDTIQKESGRFLAYNNGISVTATKIDAKYNNDIATIFSITGMQIVNGAQTVASIHRAVLNDHADISNIKVQAKITVVDPEKLDEIVPRISRFSNSQNQIKEADFSSNDPFHIAIQRLSETIWSPGERNRWFYERARGQYQVAKARFATTLARRKQFEETYPRTQYFTKTDLAKYLNSWDELPHIVSKGAQKNFVHYMTRHSQMYKQDWTPDKDYYIELIGKAILFKGAERVATSLKIPAYRPQIVGYSISYLSYRTQKRINFKTIWEKQGLTEGIKESFKNWIPSIYAKIDESAGDRNVGEWCKKDECWTIIKTMNLDVPESLREEIDSEQPVPTVGPAQERIEEALSSTDRENIARVMRVSAETWLKILTWGSQTRCLGSIQMGVINTLIGYASANWSNVPSRKQAATAVRILEKAAVESDIEIEGYSSNPI